MGIEDAVKNALTKGDKAGDFKSQLELNRHFSDRMERAGVITRKQAYSIPLMERIAHSSSN